MFYKRQQSLKDAIKNISNNKLKPYTKSISEMLKINEKEELNSLTQWDYISYWIDPLMKNGRELDNEIDDLFNKVIELNDSFYNKKKPLKNILKDLLVIKESLRNYEIDVEEFLHLIVVNNQAVTPIYNPVIQMLTQINNTYNRVYDLTILKLKSISTGRVTVANILISIAAIIISISSILFN